MRRIAPYLFTSECVKHFSHMIKKQTKITFMEWLEGTLKKYPYVQRVELRFKGFIFNECW